ncbi:hypothetical protein BGX26_007664, partial [Mortierella sp. AD094]
QATERIRRPRCTKTIAWERVMGITGRQKKAKYTGEFSVPSLPQQLLTQYHGPD